MTTTSTGGSETFLCALDDDVTLELAQGHEDRREEHTGRGARVDLLLYADDLYTLLIEIIDDREEVFSGAAETREALDDEDVAVAEKLLELCELRAIFGCAGNLLDEEAIGRNTVVAESVKLPIEVLRLCGNASITKQHKKPSINANR